MRLVTKADGCENCNFLYMFSYFGIKNFRTNNFRVKYLSDEMKDNIPISRESFSRSFHWMSENQVAIQSEYLNDNHRQHPIVRVKW